MNPIQLEIEGTGAIAATQELVNFEGINASYETVGEDSKAGALAAIASIVGIAAGSVDLATRLYNWYSKHRKAEPNQRIEQVVLVDRHGKRILMENVTLDQLKAVLGA